MSVTSSAAAGADTGYGSIALLVPPEDIRAHLRERHREGDFHHPKGAETLHPDAAMVRRLLDWGKRLVGTAARQPVYVTDLCRAAAVSERALENAFKEVMGLTHTLRRRPSAAERPDEKG